MIFKQFRFAYLSFLFVLKLCIFLALIIWAKNTFYYFLDNNFIELISNFNQIEKKLPQIWNITKEWLIVTGWLIFKIFVIKCIASFARNFPIYPKWLAYWDNQGEISSILGREIARHLRYKNSITFQNMIDLYNHSNHQVALLKMHSKKTHLQDFLKKYDPNFDKDLGEQK